MHFWHEPSIVSLSPVPGPTPRTFADLAPGTIVRALQASGIIGEFVDASVIKDSIGIMGGVPALDTTGEILTSSPLQETI